MPFNTQDEKNKLINKNDNEVSFSNTKRAIDKNKFKKAFSKQRTSKATNRIKKENRITDKDDVGVSSGSELKTDGNNPDVIVKDSSNSVSIETKKTDSTHVVSKDSVKKKPGEQTVKNNAPQKDSSRQKSISFSTGIAIHQLLPVDGQKLTPYNSQGRKGSLADYIPSVFVRMYKNDKWFLQSEFRVGEPQYTR